MKVMISGSFDPPTLGHLDVIARASRLFDDVLVCACVNSEKKYMFSTVQRQEMLSECCREFDNVTVALCDGLVAKFASEQGVDAIVKGLRSGADYEYECVLDTVNRTIAPIETIFLPARPQFLHLSSTVGREMIRYGCDLELYLPKPVIAYLHRLHTVSDEDRGTFPME